MIKILYPDIPFITKVLASTWKSHLKEYHLTQPPSMLFWAPDVLSHNLLDGKRVQ
jgi:hypothetical protein